MRKALAAFLTALLFTFGGGAIAHAQGPTLPAEQADDAEDEFDTGLIGLLGLRKRSTRPRAATH